MQGPSVLVFMQMCLRDIPDQITYGTVKVYFCKMYVSQNNVEQIAL